MIKFEINKEQTRYCNTSVVSVYTSIPISTLETLRVRGGGPTFIKRGKKVLYDLNDIDEYMLQRKQISTSDTPNQTS